MKELFYFMFKPGFTDDETVYEIVERLKSEGANVLEIKKMMLSSKVCKEHYAHIVNLINKDTGIPVYPKLEKYMLSDCVVGVKLEGEDGIISKIRTLMGSTKNPAEGTLRAKYIALKNIPDEDRTTKNGFHCSDSVENGKIEVDRFFNRDKELEIKTIVERNK